jgi:hypothetical protein
MFFLKNFIGKALFLNKKRPHFWSLHFLNYACPVGPKLMGIAGCSTSLISPWVTSKR